LRHSEEVKEWVPAIDRHAGPIYQAIVEALEHDIATGRLKPNDKLPSHRILGEALGVDFTTVTRAYTEARRKGLVEGRAGQGTFVTNVPLQGVELPSDTVDMAMNLPPRFGNPKLVQAMWQDVLAMRNSGRLDILLDYHVPGGTRQDRETAARWLAERLPGINAAQVLLTAGSQGALFALFGSLLEPGGTILAADLSYPGMISVARQLRLNCVGLPMDSRGVIPEALDAACRAHPAAVLYCNPTLHNPTTITTPHERRLDIIEVTRQHGVQIVEDDAYGALLLDAPAPLRTLAPELVHYIAGLSKCLSPALRLAYVALPETAGPAVRDVSAAIRATSSGVSSLTASLAASWINRGIALEVRDAIRSEAHARHELGRKILPAQFDTHPPDAFHVWLPLPDGYRRSEFAARLHSVGVGVVQSDAFSLGDAPEAVRLSLGAATTRPQLEHALLQIRSALNDEAASEVFVV